jgi:hypothetical protein
VAIEKLAFYRTEEVKQFLRLLKVQPRKPVQRASREKPDAESKGIWQVARQ